MLVTLTDHERAFADSPRGRRDVADARRRHDAREAHRGAQARPWTDAMEADAIRALSAHDARGRVATAAFDAGAADRLAIAQVQRDTAHAMQTAAMRDAWRNGR